MALVSNTETDDLMGTSLVQKINDLLVEAQARGLSLPGGLNVLAHSIAMVLVSAFADPTRRSQVACAIPVLVESYMPQWEKIIADARAAQEVVIRDEADVR